MASPYHDEIEKVWSKPIKILYSLPINPFNIIFLIIYLHNNMLFINWTLLLIIIRVINSTSYLHIETGLKIHSKDK